MKKLIFTSLLALLCGWLASVPAQAITIGFNPSSPYTVQKDKTLSVDVVVSGLGKLIVSAFDLDMLYDPQLLFSQGIAFGPSLGNPGLGQVLEYPTGPATDPWVGVLDFSAVSLLSDTELKTLQQSAQGTLTLATLNFDVLQDGTAALQFSWEPGNMIVLAPEPGSVLLLATGLLAGAFRRYLGRKAS